MDEEKSPDTESSAQKDSQPHSILRGEILRTVFASDDGSYSVVRVKDESGAEQTVVGTVPSGYEGQTIEAAGHWEKHREHGRQFRASSCKCSLPKSPEGIARYLASGVIPGIGPKFAQAIVERFGTGTLNILSNYSARIMEVPGIGKKKLESLRKAWKEHESERELHIFFQSLGIGQALSSRIIKNYGTNAPQVVRDNPYRLAEEIKGIGFTISDKMAMNLGIEKSHSARLCAGAVYLLNRLAEIGHTCYPEEDFLSALEKLLTLESEFARQGLDIAIERKLAVRENSPELGSIVFGKYLFEAENELSRHLERLLSFPRHAGSRVPPEPPPASGLQLSDEQVQSIGAVFQNPITIITGGPGVGKTTIVGEVVRRAKLSGLKVILAAPTGRAAKRLGESCKSFSMTIHRMLKWDPVEARFAFNSSNQLRCDLIVVDEVSMLDIPLAMHLFRAIRSGCVTLLVGDADQLPSVGPGKFLKDMIECRRFKVCHLNRIYRQKEGSRIINNAHLVNRGDMPDLAPVPKDAIADFYWIDQEDPERVAEIITEMAVSRIPRRFGLDPLRDIQVITPMNKGICGTESLNRRLQDKVNPSDSAGQRKPQFSFGENILRIGDKVMQTSNNYDKQVFNGDIGKIVHIRYPEKKFTVAYDSGDVEYDFQEAEQISLAYAVTVHKSQGCEFPAVIVPILTQHFVMLQRNLIYTAMTRAKKLLVMIGTRKALAIAVKNFRVETRYSMLSARIRDGAPPRKSGHSS